MPTYQELQAQIKQLQDQAEKLLEAEISSVINEVKAKISQYNLTAEQLGLSSGRAAPRKRASAAAKSGPLYRNENGDTWSGASRGRKPAWIKQVLDAGGDIEKYRVK